MHRPERSSRDTSMSVPFPSSPGVRCQMSVHYVWVRVCSTEAALVTAGCLHKQLRLWRCTQTPVILWYENDDKCNKLNTGEGKWQSWWVSVKKCDSPAGVAARFLRGKMSLLLFKLIVLSYSNCNSRHRALHSAAPPAQSCVFQWPTVASCAIWPFVLSQGVKEHQINSMHWRIKSLGLYHTKARGKCVAFLQSPRHRQLPLHCMHTCVKSAAPV